TSLADIEIDPRALNLGMVNPDTPESGVVTLSSTTDRPFKVTRVESTHQRVTTKVEMAENGRSARISVTPATLDHDGRFTDVLLIDTDHPKVRKKRVLVMWQVSTGLSVAPSELKLVVGDRPQL